MNDDVEFNEYSIALKGVDVNFDKSLNGRWLIGNQDGV